MRFVSAAVVACAVVVSLVGNCGEANAQFIVNGPGGSLGISNGNGGYMFIYPERMNPGANQAVPGSQQMTPSGPIWLGQDNQVHGNLVDPFGNVHIRSARPQGSWSNR